MLNNVYTRTTKTEIVTFGESFSKEQPTHFI